MYQNEQVAIVGVGMSGICMAVRLKKAGIPFIIYEKNHDVGGTWLENDYPNAGCDIASHLYSYSFELGNWSQYYSKQKEILKYFQHVAKKYDIIKYVRFNTEINLAKWVVGENKWIVEYNGGSSEHQTLICACGQLNRPKIAPIPGREQFVGEQWHSARWRHDIDLKGKTVACVGNGASAMQFLPTVAEDAKQLYIFQVEPNFVVPNPIYYTKVDGWYKTMFDYVPFAQRFYRWYLYWGRDSRFFYGGLEKGSEENKQTTKQLKDYIALKNMKAFKGDEKAKRIYEASVPTYDAFCKRALIDNSYFETLNRSNVDLVTNRIINIVEDGPVTKEDGVLEDVDIIIWATGFHSNKFLTPIDVVGKNGQTLEEYWNGEPKAYLGVTVPNFPNFYMLYGPNTNLGHSSIIFQTECQVDYIISMLKTMDSNGALAIDVKESVLNDFVEEVYERMDTKVFGGSCESWYKTATGKVVNNSPYSTTEYWYKTYSNSSKLDQYNVVMKGSRL